MNRFHLFVSALAFLAASCAPDLTIYATKPGEVRLDAYEYLVVEPFSDATGQPISLPEGASVTANAPLADLLRARVLRDLSSGGQFRLLPNLNRLQGALPPKQRIAILKGEVRYFEASKLGGDRRTHVFLARKTNSRSVGELLVQGAASGIASSAERSGKGFEVVHPFVERAVAVQATFRLVAADSGQELTEPITLRAHFHKKWNGAEESSLLERELARAFQIQNLGLKDLLATLDEVENQLRLKQQNPDEYLARGLHLKKDEKVPYLLSDLRALLSEQIAQRLSEKISRHQVPFELDLASGDAVAKNLIQGGAFGEAINRLEAKSTLDSGDLYNLGVAYEALGEYSQAQRQYSRGLNQEPDSAQFKTALDRVRP